MTAKEVATMVRNKAMLDSSDEWTLFELINEVGIGK
jgi:hypothetical protein